MSRIGRLPIDIPDGVNVSVEGTKVVVKGPKGELKREFLPYVDIKIEDGKIYVVRKGESKRHREQHGLVRALINNMVIGVSKGFEKKMELVGSGYRVRKDGRGIILQLGYSHDIKYEPPDGIEIDVPDVVKLVVKGIDKELVGEVAARIRRFRPPEPYKGKGIRYEGEVVRRKAGKSGGK
jgi:large subunit ribosomal protein L6